MVYISATLLAIGVPVANTTPPPPFVRWMCYEFDTALGPPLAFLKTASRAWPELVFQLEYEEPLAGLQGSARAERGKLHDHCDAL